MVLIILLKSYYLLLLLLLLVLSGIEISQSLLSVPVVRTHKNHNKCFGIRNLQAKQRQPYQQQQQQQQQQQSRGVRLRHHHGCHHYSNVVGRRREESWGVWRLERKNSHRVVSSCLFVTNSEEFQQSSEGVVMEDVKEEELPLHHALPSLEDDGLSKTEKEFYGMMYDFQRFTPKDIDAVEDARYRALFEGVAAGATEPAVLEAFAVLFEDFRPIRLAGRMIYRHLKNVMEKNIRDKQLEDEKISCATGLSSAEIASGRRAFMAIQDEGGCEGDMTMDQLVQSGIIDTVVELLGYDTFDEFRDTMTQDKTAKFNFEKFMIGLQRCKDGSCDVQCDLTEVFDEIVKRMKSVETKRSQMTLPQRIKKNSDRYDQMVKSFEEWESLVPEGDGRLVTVLTGCFAGAKNEKIVSALKIVYMDYSALRIGGDLVFKLMSKLVAKQ